MIDALIRFAQLGNAVCVGMAAVTHRPIGALVHLCVLVFLLFIEVACADE